MTIPISMMTDSLSLFDVITKATVTTEKRLMTDIQAIKGASKRRELEKMVFL